LLFAHRKNFGKHLSVQPAFPTHAGGTLQEFSERDHHPKHVEDMLKAQQRKSARIQISIK
jgi:hypothetical protein